MNFYLFPYTLLCNYHWSQSTEIISVNSRVVNNTCEKYCQYQYQYFSDNTFLAPHHINAAYNSNCNPNRNPNHIPPDHILNHGCGMPYLFCIMHIHFWVLRCGAKSKNRGEPPGCMFSVMNRVMGWTVRTVLLHVRSKYVSSLSLCLEILSPCVMIWHEFFNIKAVSATSGGHMAKLTGGLNFQHWVSY